MAAQIDATVGGESANSYATLEEFEVWADGRHPATAYDEATEDERTRALISATVRLDQEQYRGVRASATQALQWPRYGAEKPDLSYSDVWYASDEIPTRVKRAQMDLAYQLLAGGYSPDDTGLEGFENVQVGSLNITPNKFRRAGTLTESVRREIRPLMRSGGNTVQLLRG